MYTKAENVTSLEIVFSLVPSILSLLSSPYFSKGIGPYYRVHHGENKITPKQQVLPQGLSHLQCLLALQRLERIIPLLHHPFVIRHDYMLCIVLGFQVLIELAIHLSCHLPMYLAQQHCHLRIAVFQAIEEVILAGSVLHP